MSIGMMALDYATTIIIDKVALGCATIIVATVMPSNSYIKVFRKKNG